MTIRSILVNLDVDHPTGSLLAAAVDLARRLDAKLIGFAAAAPPSPEVPIAAAAMASSWYENNRAEVESRLAALEGEFEATVPAQYRTGFLSFVDPPTESLLGAASMADLILLGGRPGHGAGSAFSVDLGHLLLGSGRPILIAAAGVSRIDTDKVIVGWKDTREARRAISDALPLLQQAKDVTVITLTEGDRAVEQARLTNVVDWLASHGVAARGEVFSAPGSTVSLADITRLQDADLVVTGGYGHSRLREWFFGGATRDLLAEPTINRLMSN